MESEPKVVIVLGLYRSGTSCMAGMLQRLGVPMGKSGLRAAPSNPKGFYEDRKLRRILYAIRTRDELLHFPLRLTHAEHVALFRQWAFERSAQDGALIGGKLPFLCRMVPAINEAWQGQWLAIIPERNPAESAKSWGSRWRKLPPPKKVRQRVVRSLIALAAKRDWDLARLAVPTLRIAFRELFDNTAGTVDRLAAFCGLTPTDAQRQEAIAFVDPALNHWTPIGHAIS